VSKERARRRSERQAQAAALAAARARDRQRRERRRQLLARARPTLPRRGRVARLWTRRTRRQRLGVVVVVVLSQVLVWVFVASWSVRILALLVAIIGTPAVVTLALDRGNR
jgi:hypothetical protein